MVARKRFNSPHLLGVKFMCKLTRPNRLVEEFSLNLFVFVAVFLGRRAAIPIQIRLFVRKVTLASEMHLCKFMHFHAKNRNGY